MRLRNFLKYCLLIISFIFLGISCSKNDATPDTSASAAGNISLAVPTVKGYEIVLLNVKDFELNQAVYEIEVGDRKIKAVKNSDNSLSFITPGDIATGKYTINAPFAKNSIEVYVTAPTAISDPVAFVNNLIGNPDADEKLFLEVSGNSSASAEVLAAKNSLKQAYEKFNSLSPTEKQVAAQVLKANEEFFLESNKVISAYKDLKVESPAIGFRSQYDQNAKMLAAGGWDDCKKWYCHPLSSIVKIGAVILLAETMPVAAAGVAVLVGVDIALSLITGKKSATLSIMLTIVAKALDMAYWAPVWGYNVVLDKTSPEVTAGLRTGTDNINILKSEKFNFKPDLQFRTLNASDVNSESILIKEAVTILEKAKTFYTSTLGSPAGAFPAYQHKTAKGKASSLEQFEIKVSGNSLVTVTAPVGKVDDFSVTFNSTSDQEQAFQLQLKYKNEVEQITQTLQAKLIPKRTVTAEKIESYGGNMQPFAGAGKRAFLPLNVKVRDAAGNSIEGVEVEWKVKSGGGKLYSRTSSQFVVEAKSLSVGNDPLYGGVAEIEWYPQSEGIQEVEAIARKKDGSLVSGSPVSFKIGLPIVGKWKLISYKTKNGNQPWKIRDIGTGSFIDLTGDQYSSGRYIYTDYFNGSTTNGALVLQEFDTYYLSFYNNSGLSSTTPRCIDGIFKIKSLTATELVLTSEGQFEVYGVYYPRDTGFYTEIELSR